MSRRIVVRRLGLVGYAEGLELQTALVARRAAGEIDDTLLLLQHPHVLTLGVKAGESRNHVLQRLVTAQIKDADVVALSKVDIPSTEDVLRAGESIRLINPEADIMRLSVVTGEGLSELSGRILGRMVSK